MKSAKMSLLRLPLVLFSRRWLLPTVLVILGVALLVRLGFWQLDRREQRQTRNIELARQLAQSPVHLDGSPLPGAINGWRDRQVTVRGEFDFSQQVVILAQNYQGRPGVHLVTPLRIEGSDQAILVNRGWVPSREAVAGNLASYNEPGSVKISGTIQLPQSLPRAAPASERGRQSEWYRVDIPAIQAQLPYPVMPFYVQQSPAADGAGSLPYRIAGEVDLGEGPHLGYALQWFLFSLILLVGYLALVWQNQQTKVN
jgi:surfeit locus 1 family protein